MIAVETLPLALLYESDETAWLEAMSTLAAESRFAEMDRVHLSEYLSDMAKRDRREVNSRLALLIAHLLKWQYQPTERSASWRTTIEVQRQELADLLESGTLRNHAVDMVAKAYANGVRQASAETRLNESAFPAECPYDVDGLLSEPLD